MNYCVWMPPIISLILRAGELSPFTFTCVFNVVLVNLYLKNHFFRQEESEMAPMCRYSNVVCW